MNNKHVMRFAWVDILRGLAIMLMIPANLAVSLQGPHAILFRLFVSYAAPIFITVCAGMVVLNAHYHNLNYYITRSFYILLIGVLLDTLVFNILPFHSFDVLYIIALSLPVAYLVKDFKYVSLIGMVLFFFIMSAVLQKVLGYNIKSLQIQISSSEWVGFSRIFYSFLIDGWFPLFPWLGYTFLGVALFRYLFSKDAQHVAKALFLFAWIIAALGHILLFAEYKWLPNLVNGGVLAIRSGYIEVFYPPCPAFLCATIGVIILLSGFTQDFAESSWSRVIAKFGQYSLFVYIVHLVIGKYVLEVGLSVLGLAKIESKYIFTVVILAVYICIYFMLICLDKIKTKHQPTSEFMQLLIGRKV